MNIMKLAAGRQVTIRVTIDYDTGTFKAQPVDSGEQKGCHGGAGNSLNHRLLELLHADLPEYGTMEVTDRGLTGAGFAEKEKGRQPTHTLGVNPLENPLAHKPLKDKSGTFTPQQPSTEKQLDTGFGV